jgi:hypothetical protein
LESFRAASGCSIPALIASTSAIESARGTRRAFALDGHGALLSRFGGNTTTGSASDYVSTFRGEGVEPDLFALPVGLRFNPDAKTERCRSYAIDEPRHTYGITIAPKGGEKPATDHASTRRV